MRTALRVDDTIKRPRARPARSRSIAFARPAVFDPTLGFHARMRAANRSAFSRTAQLRVQRTSAHERK